MSAPRSRRPAAPARALVAALLVLLAALLTACKANADVAIDVRPDGSGTVTVTVDLDAEAIAELGGDVAAAVRLDDLEAAGWEVTGPTEHDGGTRLVLTKPFARPEDLGAILDEVGGARGVFRDWELTSTDAFTVTDHRLTGTIELTGDLDQFSDADVATALDGLAVGRTPEELAAALQDDPEALTLTVSVNLPGERNELSGLTADDAGSDAAAASARFTLGTGEGATTKVVVASSDADRSPVMWILVGGGLVVAAIALVAASLRRPRSSRRSPRPPPAAPPRAGE